MKTEIGERVGAVKNTVGKVVNLFGWGEYLGEEIPPKGVGVMGDLAHDAKLPSPKIKLDSGDIVWGFQCWWGPEERIRNHFEGKTFEIVGVEDER